MDFWSSKMLGSSGMGLSLTLGDSLFRSPDSWRTGIGLSGRVSRWLLISSLVLVSYWSRFCWSESLVSLDRSSMCFFKSPIWSEIWPKFTCNAAVSSPEGWMLAKSDWVYWGMLRGIVSIWFFSSFFVSEIFWSKSCLRVSLRSFVLSSMCFFNSSNWSWVRLMTCCYGTATTFWTVEFCGWVFGVPIIREVLSDCPCPLSPTTLFSPDSTDLEGSCTESIAFDWDSFSCLLPPVTSLCSSIEFWGASSDSSFTEFNLEACDRLWVLDISMD